MNIVLKFLFILYYFKVIADSKENDNIIFQKDNSVFIPAGDPARNFKDTGSAKSNVKFDSSLFWESRYKANGNSGAGSYNDVANFKAKILNEFVSKNNVVSVAEFGFGDGNQLSLAKYPYYFGFDVSPNIWFKTKTRFSEDTTKTFFVYHAGTSLKATGFSADMVISLDVIYHLVEDRVYEQYMENIFSISRRFVVIFSSNFNGNHVRHVRNRRFLPLISEKFKDFKLVGTIGNPVDKQTADFYFFQKVERK